jgi:hypothetical protein
VKDAPKEKSSSLSEANPKEDFCSHSGGEDVTGDHRSLPGTGVASMRIKNVGGNWTAWQTYEASKDWRLTPGAGKKMVYVQYKDAAGNVSAKASDSITYRP